MKCETVLDANLLAPILTIFPRGLGEFHDFLMFASINVNPAEAGLSPNFQKTAAKLPTNCQQISKSPEVSTSLLDLDSADFVST
jgi:hypothetical protein